MQLHGLMYVVSTLGRRNCSVRVKAPRSVSTTSSRIDSNQTLENTSRLVENIQWFHNYTCWNGGIGFGIWQPGNEAQQLSVFCRNCWLLLFNLAQQQTANRHRTPLTAAEVNNLNTTLLIWCQNVTDWFTVRLEMRNDPTFTDKLSWPWHTFPWITRSADAPVLLFCSHLKNWHNQQTIFSKESDTKLHWTCLDS